MFRAMFAEQKQTARPSKAGVATKGKGATPTPAAESDNSAPLVLPDVRPTGNFFHG